MGRSSSITADHEMLYYVYLHRRADDGRVFYVGSAGEKKYRNPSRKYKRAYDKNIERHNSHWHAIVQQAGGYRVEIVQECGSDLEARQLELKIIDRYGLGNLANLRRQSTAWEIGRRIRHGRSGESHPNYGIILSSETRRKKSLSLSGDRHHLKGRKLPEEWKAHIAEAKRGELNPMWGKCGELHPNTKKVVNRETGVIYPSISAAAKAEGYKMQTLANWLSGFRLNPTDLVLVTKGEELQTTAV